MAEASRTAITEVGGGRPSLPQPRPRLPSPNHLMTFAAGVAAVRLLWQADGPDAWTFLILLTVVVVFSPHRTRLVRALVRLITAVGRYLGPPRS